MTSQEQRSRRGLDGVYGPLIPNRHSHPLYIQPMGVVLPKDFASRLDSFRLHDPDWLFGRNILFLELVLSVR